MRLSDILKKAGQQNQPTHPGAARETTPQKSHTDEKETTQNRAKNGAVMGKLPILRAEDTYNKAISEIKSVVDHLTRNERFPERIQSPQEVIELVEDQNEDIAALADKATPDLYLYSHSVNVCIFSAMLGNQLGIAGKEMGDLAHSSFFHDLGMTKHLGVAQKKGKLSPAEFSLVKNHPPTGKDLLQVLDHLSPELQDIVGSTILQIHERVNGGGYPSGLKGSEISKFARVIAVCDVYEALTHPRAYRDRFIPHEAMKMMIRASGADFDPDILKAFIEKISLYPPGSYVRLNSDEIARVIKVNPGLPTRPVVKCVANGKGQKITENKVIDLAANSVICIKEAVDETRLELTDKRLALELKAVRWWVKNF